MVSTTYPKKKLLQLSGLPEKDVLEALPKIKASVESVGDDEVTVEITQDRPDLFSVYGAARSLRGHFGKQLGLAFAEWPASGVKFFVEPEAEALRPVLVGALVQGLQLDHAAIQHLFQVQEKLDLTLGRRRKKGSIGLYDLDKLKSPFYLKNASMGMAFVPLKGSGKMTVRQILKEHPTGKDYAHLVKGKQYPVLVDSKGEVLSLVDIINAVSSAVAEKTQNILIDITGTDFYACNASLNILCQDFADMGGQVKTVEIHHASKKIVTPDSRPEKMVLSVEKTNALLGTALTPKAVVQLLRKQRLEVSVGRDVLDCFVPRYRADFLHEIDLVEEVALAHGFNAFQIREPSLFTVGSKSKQTDRVTLARDALSSFGFLELMTHVVFSPEKAAKSFAEKDVVRLKNPVSEQYSSLRSMLLPSVLEALSRNTHQPYPQKVFEVGQVIEKDGSTPTGTRTDVNAVLVSVHALANLTEVASLLDEGCRRFQMDYELQELKHPRFIDGRAGSIVCNQEAVGTVGELSPQVLENYGLQMPASAFEIRLIKGTH